MSRSYRDRITSTINFLCKLVVTKFALSLVDIIETSATLERGCWTAATPPAPPSHRVKSMWNELTNRHNGQKKKHGRRPTVTMVTSQRR